MTDAYQNRTATAVARLRYGAIESGSFHDCSWASLPAHDISPVESMLYEAAGK